MTRPHLWLSTLPLLSCAPAQAEPRSGTTAPVVASTSLPSQVLPHCLYGLDPHDQAVQAWPAGPDPQGYRLEPSTPLHLLSWLGFRDEDILTGVNGLPLGSAEHHYVARLATQAATHCRWEVLRGDQAAVVEATITLSQTQALVLERDAGGMPTRLSRAALHQRLSDPYAFGRYASMLAMPADDGVYLVDKGLVALVGELGFQPLDHHIAMAGVTLGGGRAVLEGLTHLLTDPELSWTYRRGGQVQTLSIHIDGEPLVLPGPGPGAPGPSEE